MKKLFAKKGLGRFSRLLRSSLLHQIHKTYNQRQPLFKSFTKK